jgi:hypothetical protein
MLEELLLLEAFDDFANERFGNALEEIDAFDK